MPAPSSTARLRGQLEPAGAAGRELRLDEPALERGAVEGARRPSATRSASSAAAMDQTGGAIPSPSGPPPFAVATCAPVSMGRIRRVELGARRSTRPVEDPLSAAPVPGRGGSPALGLLVGGAARGALGYLPAPARSATARFRSYWSGRLRLVAGRALLRGRFTPEVRVVLTLRHSRSSSFDRANWSPMLLSLLSKDPGKRRATAGVSLADGTFFCTRCFLLTLPLPPIRGSRVQIPPPPLVELRLRATRGVMSHRRCPRDPSRDGSVPRRSGAFLDRGREAGRAEPLRHLRHQTIVTTIRRPPVIRLET